MRTVELVLHGLGSLAFPLLGFAFVSHHRRWRSGGLAFSVKSVSLTCSKLFLSVSELGRWWLKRGRGVGGKTYSVPNYFWPGQATNFGDFGSFVQALEPMELG